MVYLLTVVVALLVVQSESFSLQHKELLHHPRYRPSPRIINGNETDIRSHPYQVSIEYYNDLHCGGAILSKHFVVTAAHCTYWAQAGVFHIRAGTTHSLTGGQRILVKNKYEHPGFSHWTYDNDLCLLELAKPLVFSDTVQPVELPAANFLPEVGSAANVSGWGSVKDEVINTTYVGRLRVAAVPLVDDGACRQAYLGFLPVTERMICAGGNGRDACHGDSGGPLVQKNTLVGVVSWGKGCGTSYGVYTRVSALRGFIDDYIKDDN